MENRTCAAPEGCDRADIVGHDGFCRKHYQRKWKYGDPSFISPPRPRATCSECGRPAVGYGYCTKHYHRFHVHGDPNIVGKVGNNGNQRKYSVNREYFKEIDTPEKAYWLGFLAADGSITNNPGGFCLSLELAECDASHVLKFARAIGSDAPVSPSRQNCVRTRINCWQMVEDLAALGIVARKSLVVEPPLDKLAGLERYYWRGLWDGDGWISKGPRSWDIGLVGSLACVDGFASWGRGISGSRARSSNKCSPNPRCWRWSVGGTRKPRLLAAELRLAGLGFELDRKQVLLEEFCAINLDERKARLDASRAVKMRDAWATGRHSRAKKT